MTTAYIGLGSNLGDGRAILKKAWQRIGEDEKVQLQRLSSPYLSAPLDMVSTNWFTNGAGGITTSFSASQLLEYLLAIEAEFGRTRDPGTQGYQDRTLDLDLLFFGEETLNLPDLILPHPHLEKRLFVLAPLAEIAPDFCHREGGRSMKHRLDHLISLIESGSVEPQEVKRAEWEARA